MNITHVLNGDSLADQFRKLSIKGKIIICREALISGDIMAANLLKFWEVRTNYLSIEYGVSPDDYHIKIIQEFEKLINLPKGSEVCLWFENDLFCQVNLWFVVHLLSERTDLKIYRVFPVTEDHNNIWEGFSLANHPSLTQALRLKIRFTPEDMDLGKALWMSYQNQDYVRFIQLSYVRSQCFEQLEQVCQAHLDRIPTGVNPGRPEKMIGEIIASGVNNFSDIFTEFSKREGIYGFGDLQLLSIYNNFINI